MQAFQGSVNISPRKNAKEVFTEKPTKTYSGSTLSQALPGETMVPGYSSTIG
jgi:hypothetical protein